MSGGPSVGPGGTRWPEPSLRYLARLTDAVGIVEHARLDDARRELGYCTDDAGRLLAVASKLPSDRDAHRLATTALRFLTRAHEGNGRFRTRLGSGCRWTDDPPSDDACGRALLGLGTAAARAPWPRVQVAAYDLFSAAAAFRSAHPRALAYAALGAVEIHRAVPDHPGAGWLLADAMDLLPGPTDDPAWPWPEPRLTYANALLPHALLAMAVARGRRPAADRALSLLAWLVEEETADGHFSFTPVGGRGPGRHEPGFDQQAIEAWAMADAATLAYAWTGEQRWDDAASRAGRWFLGDNDAGVPMFDPTTAGGYDGLEPRGVNRNQGAESTLAFVATMLAIRQRARAVPEPGRREDG